MRLIEHWLIGYFVPFPLYLGLAAYSLRYYASLNTVSEKAIDAFLWTISGPLRGFYAEYSKHNLLTQNPNISIAAYLRTVSHPLSAVKRVYIALGAVITVFAFTVSLMRQTEMVWQIEHILLLAAHMATAFWAWRFGSKILQIENTLY